jgi:hypothetical protein
MELFYLLPMKISQALKSRLYLLLLLLVFWGTWSDFSPVFQLSQRVLLEQLLYSALFSCALVVTLFLLIYGVGFWCFKLIAWLSGEAYREEDCWLEILAVGTFTLSCLLTLFGLFGLFVPEVLLLCLFLALLIVCPPAIHSAKITLSRVGSATNWNILVWVLFGVGFVRCFIPSTDWDTLVYHYPAIKAFLANGQMGHFVWDDPYNFPMAFQVLYAPALALNMPIAAQLFTFCFFCLGYFALVSLQKRVCPHVSDRWSSLIFFGCYCFWSSNLNGRVETSLATLFLILVLVVLKALTDSSSRLWSLSSAIILSGFLLAVKLTMAPLVLVAWCILFFVTRANCGSVSILRTSNIKLRVAFFLVLFLISLSPAVFWYGKNLINFSNPAYPKLQSDILVETKFGKKPILNWVNEFFTRNQDKFSLVPAGESLKDFRGAVEEVVGFTPIQDESTGVLYNLFFNQRALTHSDLQQFPNYLWLGLLPLWWPNRVLRYLAAVSWGYVLLLLFSASLIRYVIPILPIIILLTIFNIDRLLQLFRSRRNISLVLEVTSWCLLNYGLALTVWYLTKEVDLPAYKQVLWTVRSLN